MSGERASSQSDKILRESWSAYKKVFIEDGRVIDPDAEITTSEGQSYAMLRAAFLDDKDTFESVWTWTRKNLRRKDGKLFAWKWGKHCDESMGILDEHTASDADEDIALALIVAGSRWDEPALIKTAQNLLHDIWNIDVIEANGIAFMGPGDWAKSMENPRLNPSYFAPYAYRIFAQVDHEHDWYSLVNSSYSVLSILMDKSRLNLPPDWCELSRASGDIKLDWKDKETDYSYDAMRVPFRIALDWAWNRDERSLTLLKRMSFLNDSWQQQRTIRGAYAATGVTRGFDEPLAGFACALPMLAVVAPVSAQQVMQEKIMIRYYDGLFSEQSDYYGQNWCWFAIALINNKLSPPQFNRLR